MSKTKAALELGIEINALVDYLDDDLLPEHYETQEAYTNAVDFVKWATQLHEQNEALKLGLDQELIFWLRNTAREFTNELDDHDYIEVAEMLLNYYRQAWAWEHDPVTRFNVRKKAELIAQQILNKAGL